MIDLNNLASDQLEMEVTEEQMLDTAEQIFVQIAQCLQQKNLTVRDTFGSEDLIHVLEEFEGEQDVAVMTADDFITRCYQIGLQHLNQLQVACVMRVLGKPELSNAIRLNELEILMQNFLPEYQMEQSQTQKSSQLRPKSDRTSKKDKKRQ